MDNRMFIVENQQIYLKNEIKARRILDIGGGGEGIIGLCYKDKVIAIDPLKEELEEAPEGPLKIVMDGKNLCFLDNSFEVVTSFFTLMYVPKNQRKQVLSEVYRVLKNGGEFIVWEGEIPEYNGGNKDVFVINLEIHTPEKVINTAYGVLWEGKEQNIDYYINLGEEMGFRVIKKHVKGKIFNIVFRKKTEG